jgi:hypothetical protein
MEVQVANHALGGIVNQYAEQSSYVNDLRILGFTGTGLLIEAPNSGPYTNLSFNVSGSDSCPGASCPVCADIEAQTQGLHDVTCVGNAATAAYTPDDDISAGIRVNASNNSIEDVHLEAWWDGIRIGDESGLTINNIVIKNVEGGLNYSPKPNPPWSVTNIVHICGPNHSSLYGVCPANGTVTNVTILADTDANNTGVSEGGGVSTNSTAVQDDVTGTSVAAPSSVNTNGITVAMYGLGGQIGSGSGIYSHFATTPSYSSSGSGTPSPSWGVSGAPVSGSSCNTLGALYSYTGAASGAESVYVCTLVAGSATWASIPL